MGVTVALQHQFSFIKSEKEIQDGTAAVIGKMESYCPMGSNKNCCTTNPMVGEGTQAFTMLSFVACLSSPGLDMRITYIVNWGAQYRFSA